MLKEAEEEAERKKRAAMASDDDDAEDGQKSDADDGGDGGAADEDGDAKPASVQEAPAEEARPFTPEEEEEIKLAAGDSDDEFELIAIKEKVKEFQKGADGAARIPPHLINEAVRWRLNRNDCQNRGYVLDGYPKNAQSA